MKTLHSVMIAASALLVPGLAPAQTDFPSKPIRMVIGFPPGGPTDIIGRAMALKMPEASGQQMIIDNRGGANGIVGAELVAKSPADGYTAYFATMGVLLAPIILPKVSVNLQRDFVPVTLAATVPMVLVVHPSLPVKTAKELVALAKARPREIAYSSSGNASMGNLSMESFKLAAGIDILHVPYKGAAPSVLNLVGGHVQTAVLALPPLLPQIREGKVRALAVTSPKRSPTVPDVPTIEQAGFPQARADNWFGVLLPKDTPRTVANRLHEVLTKSLIHPETKAYLDKQGAEIIASNPEAFAEFLKTEYAKWEKVIHKTGIKAE